MLRVFATIIFCLTISNSYADVIQLLDEGTSQGFPSKLNCVGSGIACTRSGTTGILTISGGSGTPGGSDTQVQFNDAGSFGGDSGMVFNKTTNALTVGGTITVNGMAVSGGSEKILTSSGSVTMGGTGNTNNEKLLLDFESAANKLTLSSATGLATIDYGSIAADYDSSTVTLSTVAGAINAASATSLAIPNGAAPTVNVFGQIAGDNNLWAVSRGAPIFYDGTAATALVNVLVSDTPSNGQVPTWNTGGTITWETGSGGGGSTTKCINIDPGSMMVTGTMALTGDATVGATIDSSNGSVLLFPDTTDAGAAKRIRLPSNWSAHGTIRLTYSMTTGTANEVEWEAFIMCQSSGDAQRDDADSFAAAATTVDTVPATVRFPKSVNITPTDDSCAADDIMTINISTDSDDAVNDDATGTRRLIGLEYCYTES